MHRDNNKLVIVKKGGSDPDAFKEPLRFECIWSVFPPGNHKWSKAQKKTLGTGLILSTAISPFQKIGTAANIVEDEVPPSGSFWRAIAPPGYTALGDIALPIDGAIGVSDDGGTATRKSSRAMAGDVLQTHAVPKYVCIKDEYLSQFRALEVDGVTNNGMNGGKGGLFSGNRNSRKQSFAANKVRNRLWCSDRCTATLVAQAGIYEQATVTRDIMSPMVCKRGLDAPTPQELAPTMDIEQIIEASPYWVVVKSGFLRKKGVGMVAQSHKRFFVLTNEKKLYYFGDLDCKGIVDLNKMRKCESESDKKFYIDTREVLYSKCLISSSHLTL